MVRLLSGFVLGAAALAAIVYLPAAALRVVAVAVALVATHEYLGIVRRGGRPASNALVYVLAGGACWLLSAAPPQAEVVLAAALAVLAVEVLFLARPIGDAAAGVAAAAYIALPLAALAAIHRVAGRESVLLLLGTVVVSDSAQYYTGRAFGRHLLAPAVSPKKTVEGALGGLVFATAFMTWLGGRVYPGAPQLPLVAIGLVVAALGICGDLFESRLKRAAGVKDSSALIPGHGGVLDRIDALLLATPAFYFFLTRWV